MRIVEPPAKPLPRFEFTKEELAALVNELHSVGFGRDFRDDPKTKFFPKLDDFAFLAESLVE